MEEVKCNITNLDPITGKKMKAFLTGAPLAGGGYPLHVSFLVKYREADDTTDAVPPNNTINQKNALKPFEVVYPISTRLIKSSTKVYLPDDTQDVEKISLQDYFANKQITLLPGVGGNDLAWKFAEGVLREVVAIMQANGELPL